MVTRFPFLISVQHFRQVWMVPTWIKWTGLRKASTSTALEPLLHSRMVCFSSFQLCYICYIFIGFSTFRKLQIPQLYWWEHVRDSAQSNQCKALTLLNVILRGCPSLLRMEQTGRAIDAIRRSVRKYVTSLDKGKRLNWYKFNSYCAVPIIGIIFKKNLKSRRDTSI